MSKDRDRTLEDFVYAETIQSEAIVRLLVKKGVVTKEEFMDRVKPLNAEQQEKMGSVGMEKMCR